ncbi:MAG TPA: hypothetical protein VGY57_14625, partial [Vicinamibacterales bacterium]|nr:hypothetical protein [Vicinamibacterales bacterium]
MKRWTIRLACGSLMTGQVICCGSLIAGAFAGSAVLVAQDRLKTMPGHEQSQKISAQIPTAIKSGALAATWAGDSKSIEYTRDGKRYRYDVASHRTTELPAADDAATGRGRGSGRAGGPPGSQP